MRFLICLVMMLIGCSVNDGGGDAAVKYVRTAIGDMKVERIEAVGVDSLLCDLPLMFERNALLRAQTAYLEERISADSLRRSISTITRYYNDITDSWFKESARDSIRNVQIYAGAWRKVYTVEVTMPDGKKEHTRVLMDSDGLTARCMEYEFIDIINQYIPDIESAETTLRGW